MDAVDPYRAKDLSESPLPTDMWSRIDMQDASRNDPNKDTVELKRAKERSDMPEPMLRLSRTDRELPRFTMP
jgi:hypothetical protein